MSYASEVLADSPVAYYRMKEASGLILDETTNNNDAVDYFGGDNFTYQQTAAIQTDGSDYAIFFNASSFGSAYDASLDLGDTFSLEAWLKRSSGSLAGGIVSKQNNAYYMRLNDSNNKIELLKSNAAVIVASTTTITDTTAWHHVVVTKGGSSSANCKVYIDSIDVTGTFTDATCANNGSGLCIGSDLTVSEFFTGSLDEVAVYGTTLNAARVQAHYNAATAGRFYKRLYGPAQLTGSAADLYTCPADTVARVLNVHASNPSGSPVDINLSIGADAAATRIFEDYAVPADGIVRESYPYELAAGEKLQGWADSAGTVVLSITGYEEPA